MFKLKKTLCNHTQAAGTAGNNLKFLMIKSSNFPFYLLFTLELLLRLGSEGMVQIILKCRSEVSYDKFENYFGFS